MRKISEWLDATSPGTHKTLHNSTADEWAQELLDALETADDLEWAENMAGDAIQGELERPSGGLIREIELAMEEYDIRHEQEDLDSDEDEDNESED